ncbi:MAG: Fe-S cluster assembly sulfur transfer protein SufU [Acidobacteriota bacterium]
MSDLRELYQEIILDHYRRPRNFRRLDNADHHALGHNPLCGDKVEIWVDVDDDGTVRDIGFQGAGCAISTASASLMTEAVHGKDRMTIDDLKRVFLAMVKGEDDPGKDTVDLDKLEALEGVREYPMRVKCATLAWHTLASALDGAKSEKIVSTE